MNDEERGAGSLTDSELRERRALIDAEIEAREAERARAAREAAEEERARARASRARARQALPSVGEWVQLEYTRCARLSCKICGGTRYAHGPYWFHYFRSRSGRQTSRYVGRVLDARSAEVLAAHEERRRAKEARAREAAALARGEDPEVQSRSSDGLDAEALVGLTPQEVYPEAFSSAERPPTPRGV